MALDGRELRTVHTQQTIGQIIKLYKTLKEFCPQSTPPQRLPGVGLADSTLPCHCMVNVFIGWSTDPVYHPTVVFPRK